MSNLFLDALKKQNTNRPPVWFMRQAGRYHSHYQNLRKKHSFIDLCKIPDIACEATMGPIRDFDFDAAILFSDLLFPLEVMGMPLKYDPGPKLGSKLKTIADVEKLTGGAEVASGLNFQGEAIKKIRAVLPKEKGLIGFVGGPLTLFCYAVDGSHKDGLHDSLQGIKDGRFNAFNEKLEDLLAENMAIQARAGADAIVMMDTCAGEFTIEIFKESVIPATERVLKKFYKRCPDFPVLYYSKGTNREYWDALRSTAFVGIGIDWNSNIADVLIEFSDRFVIQGNFNPNLFFEDINELEKRIRKWFEPVLSLDPKFRKSWICGLGHGVLPGTPEASVRLFLKIEKELWSNG
jgi:uroporphyrinogen decarboxylase